MHLKKLIFSAALPVFLLPGCGQPTADGAVETDPQAVTVEQMGYLAHSRLIETSGMQASHSRDGDFFVHNDDGEPVIYAINQAGANLGELMLVPAKNKDWEDLTMIPVEDSRWLVVGDIGDNRAKRESIKLYFTEEPQTGKNDRYSGHLVLEHWIELTYPDGARDCEAMAYDAVGDRILLLSKRDKPPHLYAVDRETALSQGQAELEYLGNIHPMRPPTPADRARFGGRTDWISQPTGMDISPDGKQLVVLTYRSLYRFRRQDGEDWLSALQRKPDEMIGPPAPQNEAVAYSSDGEAVYVTTEKIPAPVFKIQFNDDL